METFGSRLRRLLEEKNITAAELSRRTELSQALISQYINDKFEPKNDKIYLIAKALNVSEFYLMGWEDEPNKPKFMHTDVILENFTIPILGSVPCGKSYEAIEDILGHIDINKTLYNRGVRYALLADGDSMDPDIKDGDIMFIKPTPQVDSGSISIVKINGFEATCKKVLIGDKTVTLVPSNNKYEVSVFTEEDVLSEPLTIIGQVLSSQRMY